MMMGTCADSAAGFGGFNHGTPLAFAAFNRDVKLLTQMLACGADPNLQGS